MGEEYGRGCREEIGMGRAADCRKKRRTSGVIIWMGYSEDRSGSHDFSGGGRRSCQDSILGRTGDRVPVRLVVTCLPGLARVL